MSALKPGVVAKWRAQNITVHGGAQSIEIPAFVCETVAIHQLVGLKTFGITCVPVGHLMTWNYLVFREAPAAMRAAVQMLEFTADWVPFFSEPRPPTMQSFFERLMKQALGHGDLVRM